MKILELSKKYVEKFCNGDYDAAIAECYGVVYDDQVIKQAFNYGNGTEKHMKRHMQNNRAFCKYYDLERKCYV